MGVPEMVGLMFSSWVVGTSWNCSMLTFWPLVAHCLECKMVLPQG